MTKAAFEDDLYGSKIGGANINTLTMEKYFALSYGNLVSGVVKPEIRGNFNFEIKSQFIRELREDTFSGNKNDDAHKLVKRILDSVSLFNIPGVTHDAVMLRVFPITLTGAAMRWPPEGQHLLKGLDTMTHQLLDSYASIPNKTPAHALDAIQTMADHLQKWHDGSTSRKVSNGCLDGIAAIANKLDSLGRDIKKLKENVHAIPRSRMLRKSSMESLDDPFQIMA
nr:hypothetical protein [Tanacetum cinerariifolium]